MTFTILAVCTGNVCRSPIAQLVLSTQLADIADVKVLSAGTAALVGHAVPEQSSRIAARYGLDATHHRAQQATEALIGSADLILTMARDHRRYVLEAAPAALRRTFTLRELARITEEAQGLLPQTVRDSATTDSAYALQASIRLASHLRSSVASTIDASDFDIVDPFRRSDDVYEQAFSELVPAAERVSRYLRDASALASAAANRDPRSTNTGLE